jgi:hypothetical protein
MPEPGFVDGRHYTEWVDSVRQLRRGGDDGAALKLLEKLMRATLQETAATGLPPAPWYFEQAAIIHRKAQDPAAEVAVLKRFLAGMPSGFEVPPQIPDRLRKAEALVQRQRASD